MRSRRYIGILSVAIVLLMVLAGFAAVPAGAGDNGAEKRAVIVGFKGKMDESLIKSNNGKVDHKLDIANAIATKLTESAIKALKNNKNVAYVEDDIEFRAVGQTLPWGVNRIDADQVWGGTSGYTGSGIQVAVVDTGIDTEHPDLQDNYLGGYDFVNDDSDPSDDNGHGTHVAGTIAAVDNTVGVIGVAPEAGLYALKVLNNRGSGFLSDIAAGIQWAMLGPDGTEDTGDEAEVVSLSLGASSGTTTLQTAVDNAYAAGLLVVAAAGNAGSTSILYPAKYGSVIAVSATDISDNLASFSNYGNEIEIAAPGVNIYSTMPTYDVYLTTSGPPKWRYSKEYDYMSGTSMACPHVSGVAALVYEAGPSDDSGVNGLADEVRKILQDNAEDLGDSGWDSEFGHGLVDAEASVGGGSGTSPTVSIASPIDGSTVSGTVTITADASDSDGTVSSVQFLVDDIPLSTDNDGSDGWSASWDSTGVTDGEYMLKAVATDNDDNTASDSVTVTTDNVNDPPTVSWVNPSDGNTVGGSVTIQIDATDDRVTPTVTWSVGGTIYQSTSFNSDSGYFEATWDTTSLSDGPYTLYAKATDGTNNPTTSISVTVSNTVQSMYVGSITWKETGPHLKATVTILSGPSSPVSGATLQFSITTGSTTEEYTGTTDSSGVVEFQWKRAPSGTYEASVISLTHSTYSYDSDLDTLTGWEYTKS